MREGGLGGEREKERRSEDPVINKPNQTKQSRILFWMQLQYLYYVYLLAVLGKHRGRWNSALKYSKQLVSQNCS